MTTSKHIATGNATACGLPLVKRRADWPPLVYSTGPERPSCVRCAIVYDKLQADDAAKLATYRAARRENEGV